MACAAGAEGSRGSPTPPATSPPDRPGWLSRPGGHLTVPPRRRRGGPPQEAPRVLDVALEEEGGEEAAPPPCTQSAERDAKCGEQQAAAHHAPGHGQPWCAECHRHADFAAPFADLEGQHAIETGHGQQHRQHREEAHQGGAHPEGSQHQIDQRGQRSQTGNSQLGLQPKQHRLDLPQQARLGKSSLKDQVLLQRAVLEGREEDPRFHLLIE